jgi:hypothetical protein
MPAPYTGGCLCGAVRYRLTGEPLTFYACHCTDCQTRSGSAFGLSMWVKRDAIEITKGDAALHVSTVGGKQRKRRICAECLTNLFSEPREGSDVAVLRPGTLDDTKWLKPAAHIWTRSAQPGTVFAPDAVKFEQNAGGPDVLIRLWKERRA